MTDPVWIVLAFVIGLFIGSFLNVCIYRLPRDQSIVKPRSRCPHCERMIVWHDNVPVLSYLALGAKCRHCKKPIHWRYPVIELLTGALTAATIWHFGNGPVGWIDAAFIWSLIVVSFIDLEHRIIPLAISVGGLLAGLALSAIVPQLHGTPEAIIGFSRAGLGALIGCGLLYLTGSVGSFFFKKEAMGLGDVDLMAMAGAFLGWRLVTLSFFIAPVMALIPGIFVLLRKKEHEIPYGPFLSLGLLVALFAGDRVIAASGIEETIRAFASYYGVAP